MYLYKVLFLSFFSFVLFSTACKKKTDPSVIATHQEVDKYFKGHTQGLISDNSTIEYYLQDSIDINIEDFKKAFNTDPHFDFDIEKDDLYSKIVLRSKSALPRGKTIKIVIDLTKIFDGAKGSLVHSVWTQEQFITVLSKGFTIDENERYFLNIKVETALNEDPNKIAKLFKISSDKIRVSTLTEGEYNVQLEFSPSKKSAFVDWNAAAIGVSESGKLSIPAISNDVFAMVESHFDDEESTYFISFSERLSTSQDLKGMITINDEDADVEINGNTLKVFIPSNSQKYILRVEKGILSKNEKTLNRDLTFDIDRDPVLPSLEWLGSGSYLPASGKFKVPFRAKGLNEVRIAVIGIPAERGQLISAWSSVTDIYDRTVRNHGKLVYYKNHDLSQYSENLNQWNEFGLDLSKEVGRQSGMIYHVNISFDPLQTTLECNNPDFKNFEPSVIDSSWFSNPSCTSL